MEKAGWCLTKSLPPFSIILLINKSLWLSTRDEIRVYNQEFGWYRQKNVKIYFCLAHPTLSKNYKYVFFKLIRKSTTELYPLYESKINYFFSLPLKEKNNKIVNIEWIRVKFRNINILLGITVIEKNINLLDFF